MSSCRTMRPRPLPSAARMASSLCRAVPRASSMLATFAQAMSRTRITAPSSASRTGRTGPTRSSSSGAARMVAPVWSTSREAMRGPSTSRSACALCTEKPGLSRAKAVKECRFRVSSSNFVHSMGRSACASLTRGKRKPLGITPTTV